MSFVNLIIILKIGKMIEKKSTAISFKKHAIFSKVNVELDLHSSDVGDVITLAHTSGKLPIIVRDWKGNTGSKMCSAPHHTTPHHTKQTVSSVQSKTLGNVCFKCFSSPFFFASLPTQLLLSGLVRFLCIFIFFNLKSSTRRAGKIYQMKNKTKWGEIKQLEFENHYQCLYIIFIIKLVT